MNCNGSVIRKESGWIRPLDTPASCSNSLPFTHFQVGSLYLLGFLSCFDVTELPFINFLQLQHIQNDAVFLAMPDTKKR